MSFTIDPKLLGLVDEVAHSLARVHTVTPATHPGLVDGAPRGQSEGDPCEAALVFLREVLDRIDRPQPAFEYALRWLADHRPPPAPVTLVHGDYRTGNFMVAPDGLRGVLDWEFAHWSSPAEDLAWISVRDWRFGALDSPIGGFARREPFYEAYQRAGGRPVDRDEVRWWEVAGNVGWGSASVFQGQRYTSGEEDDYELIAIGRRPSEMAFEALRLVRQGR